MGKQRHIKIVLILILGIFILQNQFSVSQELIRCGTVENSLSLQTAYPNMQTDAQFEQWLATQIEERKQLEEQGLIIDGVYQIPIIVHVIHNGEPVGSGSNISYAAILSQIDVLNEDFRRKPGTSGYNTHPDGADVGIEFCLAQRRPNGTAFPNGENGVNRINRNAASFSSPPYSTTYINNTIKPYCTVTQGYSANNYMNFWSLNLGGNLLGYAQFPLSLIGGISCSTSPANTDGVVMHYATVGKSSVTGQAPPYNQGRTSTHEIGHWLGLRHIWGDSPNCAEDDYCQDTPPATTASNGCNLSKSSCGSLDMVRNYMDYSNDACMNIFTKDQRRRMRTVLEKSPRRSSLLVSDACVPPLANDASIVNILTPEGDHCAGAITPTVTLRNRGTNNLTSATIEYTIDGNSPTTFNWTGNLAPGNQENVALPSFTAPLGGHLFRAVSLLPNGVSDPHTDFDASEIVFFVSNGIENSHVENFEAAQFPPNKRWMVDNPNNDCYTWVAANAVSSSGTASNTCAMMDNYNNSSYYDEFLYTPYFLLPCNATSAKLTFDVAYRQYDNSSNDRLRVEVSSDCHTSWTYATIYDKSGSNLRTVTSPSANEWYPTSAGQWRTETIDLSSLVSSSSSTLRFRFRATNNYGNNLFIDNVKFEASSLYEIEMQANGENVLNGGSFDFGQHPSGPPITQTFTIHNAGTSTLTLSPPISITGSSNFTVSSSFASTSIAPGATTTFSLAFTPTGAGPFVANLSFATNDCDENPYTIQLMGSGLSAAPTANFSANITSICPNNSVVFSDLSTGATSWSWTFNGGTPASASTAGPHTVTYSTPGTYSVTLSVSNSDGTDTHTETNYITVANPTGQTLPFSEGFVSTVFPPTGWTITNGGDPRTWGRTTLNGNAPTAGNAMGMDFYNTPDTSGDIDDITLPAIDLSGYTTASLTFDVAYAQYQSFGDQLDILVSPGCGQPAVVVYSKSGATLATEPSMNGPYTSVSVWRNETIDLASYLGNGAVEITFRGISGFGNILYVDNINIVGTNTGAVTADFTPSPTTACTNTSVVFTDNSTGATSWNWNFGADASPANATGQGPHTVSYSSPGTKTISLSINSGADTKTKTVLINGASAPTVTVVDNCGTSVLSASGTNLLWSTGETTASITVNTSGTYTVTQTVGGCTSPPASVPITISTSAPPPTVSATDNCGSSVLTASGMNLLWSTGETTSSITVTAPGTYTVTQTVNGCISPPASVSANPNVAPAPPTVTVVDNCGSSVLTASGTNLLWSTGETTSSITVTAPGTYTVTQTVNGCTSPLATAPANPTASPTPTVMAFDNCGMSVLTASGTNLLWSTGETTPAITVNSAGTYTVTQTVDGCLSGPASVSSNPFPIPMVILNPFPTICIYDAAFELTGGLPIGGIYSINDLANTVFNPAAEGLGTALISYQYTDANGCMSISQTFLTVDPCTSLAIEELTNEEFSVFPNPTNGQIEIKTTDNMISLQVIDNTAREIYYKEIDNSLHEQINLSAYTPGVYYIIITTINDVRTAKIIRQ